MLPKYLTILKGFKLSDISLLEHLTFLLFHKYLKRVMGLPNVYFPETSPSKMPHRVSPRRIIE